MKSKYFFILFTCALTILTQLIYHYSPASDSIKYIQLAKQYGGLHFFDPSTNCYGHPFYPLFLLLTGTLINYNHYIIGVVQTLIFCICSLFLIRELELIFKRNLISLALFLFLIPEIHFYNGYLLTESLSYSLIILIFGVGLKIYHHKSETINFFVLSLLIGLSILNRSETAIVIFPILFLIFPTIKNRFFNRLSIIVSLPILFLLINGLKNQITYQKFRLTAFNGGEVIYGGNNLNSDGSHHVFSAYPDQFLPKNKINDFKSILAMDECLSCPKRDSFYLALASDAWKTNPQGVIKTIPEKLAKNWLLPGNFDIYTGDTSKSTGLQMKKLLTKSYFNNNPWAPFKHLFYIIIHWILLSILVIGIIYSKNKNRFQISVLILLAFYILFAIPFCGLPRWHVTIFPLLIIAFTPMALITKFNSILRIE